MAAKKILMIVGDFVEDYEVPSSPGVDGEVSESVGDEDRAIGKGNQPSKM